MKSLDELLSTIKLTSSLKKLLLKLHERAFYNNCTTILFLLNDILVNFTTGKKQFLITKLLLRPLGQLSN